MTYLKLIIDHSDQPLVVVTGKDRVRFLQGMCTTNIETMKDGDGRWACLLNAKGRVVGQCEVFCRHDEFLLVTGENYAAETAAALTKYAIADNVAFTTALRPAHKVWSTPDSVWNNEMIWEKPSAPSADGTAIETLRIEAGFPLYGKDVTADNFPFETTMGPHIDYKKGCYIGQEPVSRVYFKGKPNKYLRGLLFASPVAPPAHGAQISHAEKPKAGTITSSIVSPRLGTIALGYLHRDISDLNDASKTGQQVTIDGHVATITSLPFPPFSQPDIQSS